MERNKLRILREQRIKNSKIKAWEFSLNANISFDTYLFNIFLLNHFSARESEPYIQHWIWRVKNVFSFQYMSFPLIFFNA